MRDTRVHDPYQQRGERRLESVEQATKVSPGRLVTLLDPASAAADAYRVLGANLHHALTDTPSKVIALTSPGHDEGKTTVCANLGVVLAEADESVMIIDCDLHRPAMHGAFGFRNLQGLENVLSGERRPHEIQQEPIPGLSIVTAGPAPPYPAELLHSRLFADFLRQVSSEFDYVLLDSPPMSVVPDSLVVAAQGDGVLVVLDAQNTRKEALRRTIHSLDSVRANILGTVMGNAKAGM
jgi:capsular exopolysaccharide synthesis family protein